MESADVALVKGDLRHRESAAPQSRDDEQNRQESLLRVCLRRARVPIAAGVLHSAFGLLLSPIIASAAMSLSSVSVIIQAAETETLTKAKDTDQFREVWWTSD